MKNPLAHPFCATIEIAMGSYRAHSTAELALRISDIGDGS